MIFEAEFSIILNKIEIEYRMQNSGDFAIYDLRFMIFSFLPRDPSASLRTASASICGLVLVHSWFV